MGGRDGRGRRWHAAGSGAGSRKGNPGNRSDGTCRKRGVGRRAAGHRLRSVRSVIDRLITRIEDYDFQTDASDCGGGRLLPHPCRGRGFIEAGGELAGGRELAPRRLARRRTEPRQDHHEIQSDRLVSDGSCHGRLRTSDDGRSGRIAAASGDRPAGRHDTESRRVEGRCGTAHRPRRVPHRQWGQAPDRGLQGRSSSRSPCRFGPTGGSRCRSSAIWIAADQTPIELRDTITAALKAYVTNPTVTVIVVEATAAIAYVMGEVNHPGAVTLQGGPLTVLQALAMAGGFKDFADIDNIRVLRRTPSGVQTITFNYKDAIRGGFARVPADGRHRCRARLRRPMSNSCVRLLAIAFAATTIARSRSGVSHRSPGARRAGWVLTPSLIYSSGWDDNVLIKGEGDETAGRFPQRGEPARRHRLPRPSRAIRRQLRWRLSALPRFEHAEQLRPARGSIRASPHLAPRDTVCPQQFRARADDPDGGARRRAIPPHRLDRRRLAVWCGSGPQQTHDDGRHVRLPMGGIRRRPDIRRSASRRLQQRRFASHCVAASPAAARRSSTPAFSMRWSPRPTRRSWSRTSLAASIISCPSMFGFLAWLASRT